jgi:hypothetical protein
MALTGLSKVAGLQHQVDMQPEADAYQLHGGPADPAHGILGEQAEPYPWEAYAGSWGPPRGPFGIENELLGDDSESGMAFGAGYLGQNPEGDQTPYRGHAAPFPKGRETSVSPDATSRQLIQSRALHAEDTNAAAGREFNQTMLALNDTWEGFYNPVQGEDQIPDTPGPIANQANGFGVNDHTSNPYHKANSYGLNTSHRYRRYATGSIPGNYMWMRPGGRPMVKSLPGPARPATGENSPFAGQDIGAAFSYDNGAILQDTGTEYVAPPTPYVAPAIQSAVYSNASAGEDWC